MICWRSQNRNRKASNYNKTKHTHTFSKVIVVILREPREPFWTTLFIRNTAKTERNGFFLSEGTAAGAFDGMTARGCALHEHELFRFYP